MTISRAAEKGLVFEVNIDSNIPSVLFGDEIHIRQIINNLLSNAVKYTPSGKIALNIGEKSRNDGIVCLTFDVSDTGIGIKEEDIDKLFSNFTRLDEKKNRNIEGTGLGLALTESLVKLMGGEIRVRSEYGKGSVFTVELSQKIVNEEPVGNFYDKHTEFINQRKENAARIEIPDAKILVVDDVEMNVQVVKGMLKRTHAELDTAYSGRDCIEMTAKKRYDIILLDHMMPEMDGIETFEQMKARKNSPNDGTPVIVLTANAVVGAKEMYLEKGFTDYLSKPIRRDDLIEMLHRYLPKSLVKEYSSGGSDNAQRSGESASAAPPDKSEGAEKTGLAERFPFLNTQVGLSYCMDDEDFYTEMLTAYLNGDKRQQLSETFETGDWNKYATYVHALKSTSLNIGAEALSEHARALELAAKDSDTDFIAEHHRALLDEYSEMLEKLERALAPRS